ncbi:MAG: AAA family ATPase [Acidobacteriota bacterium]|nr:AAA family ATPase [Acidobacteriota bacterium]
MPDHLPSPLQKIEPAASWSDLALPADSITQLRGICRAMQQRSDIHNVKGSRAAGIAVRFSGPSQPGKTAAAEVLANELNRNLYRIDLSKAINKYIGETEKNLNEIFRVGAQTEAILLFDEADALFGKRSDVRDSHDRYANVEVGHLTQRMEMYSGIIILATNSCGGLDPACLPRIAYMVKFPASDSPCEIA